MVAEKLPKPPVATLRVCPECEAENTARAERCWLCYRPLDKRAEVVLAEFVPDKLPARSGSEGVFAALTAAAGVLVLVMIAGASQQEPGLAGLVAVAAIPALLASVVTMAIRYSTGKPFSWRSVFVTFTATLTGVMLTFVVALVLAFLLMVAMIVALFEACAQMFGAVPQ